MLDSYFDNTYSNKYRQHSNISPSEGKALFHLGVMAYYGKYGMMDPTNFADIPMWKKLGYTTKVAFALMSVRAVIGGALLGWAVDPHNKRSGGAWEWRFQESPYRQTLSERTYYGGRQV